MGHHTPLVEAAGLAADQVRALTTVALGPLPEEHDFPARPGFDEADSLVIDLAYFLVWAGVWPHVANVHPRHVAVLRRRLYAKLAARFSPRQLEELTWRLTQCVAFNWHNEFFEIDDEPA